MSRKLSAEEEARWRRLIATVRPLDGAAPLPPALELEPEPSPKRAPAQPARAAAKPKAQPGTTLDASWDRRLSRGLVQPDVTIDLHDHDLASAYDRLDRGLDRAIASGARLLLLITGKPPSGDRRGGRGAIRAAAHDWLAASRHAGDIAAVRNAHPRHGGAGAIYVVIRRRR